MPQTVLIICEGPCNPMIGEVDTLARDFSKTKAIYTTSRPFDGVTRMLDLQRQLRHTPHTVEDHRTATCVECGRERQYGGNPRGTW